MCRSRSRTQENIGHYLKACWRLGIQSVDLFATSDLYLKKNLPKVTQNLLALAKFASTVSKYVHFAAKTEARLAVTLSRFKGPYHPLYVGANTSSSASSSPQISPRRHREKVEAKRDADSLKRDKNSLEQTYEDLQAV